MLNSQFCTIKTYIQTAGALSHLQADTSNLWLGCTGVLERHVVHFQDSFVLRLDTLQKPWLRKTPHLQQAITELDTLRLAIDIQQCHGTCCGINLCYGTTTLSTKAI